MPRDITRRRRLTFSGRLPAGPLHSTLLPSSHILSSQIEATRQQCTSILSDTWRGMLLILVENRLPAL